jgi:hypothetical protein
VTLLRWFLVVALMVPLQADATLVERDLVPQDGSGPFRAGITYDTGTGFEWLDLTRTQGLSVATVRSLQFENHPLAGGWRHASHAELCGLLEGSVGPISGCSGS